MNEKKYKYSMGDKIYFSLKGTNIEGWAKVVGCSTDDIPGAGRGWIVELDDSVNIDKKIYPFSHIIVFDVMIKDNDKTNDNLIKDDDKNEKLVDSIENPIVDVVFTD